MHNNKIDWDGLKIFNVIAETGSLRSAAKRLNISVPTVSRALDKLERHLRSELVSRDPRGIRLTPTGEIVLKQARIMHESIDAIIADASDMDRQIQGPVHLLTGDDLGPYWIAPRMAKFHQEYPKIELKLTVAPDTSDIDQFDADIAIQFIEPKRSDLISKRMGVLHYILFASPEYLHIHGEPNSFFEFERHRYLMHTSYVHQINSWRPKTADLKRIVDMSLITNSAAAMIKICQNGGGIAILPSYIGYVFPNLVPLALPELAPIQFWLTYSERTRRLSRGAAVIEFVKSCFGAETQPLFRQDFVHPREMDMNLSDANPILQDLELYSN